MLDSTSAPSVRQCNQNRRGVPPPPRHPRCHIAARRGAPFDKLGTSRSGHCFDTATARSAA